VVTHPVVIAGDVSAFTVARTAEFKAGMRTLLENFNLPEKALTLTVGAASVAVTTAVQVENGATAKAIGNQLNQYTAESLALALNGGFDVESVGKASITTVLVDVDASPPPPSKQDKVPDVPVPEVAESQTLEEQEGLSGGVIAGIILGVCAFVIVVGFCFYAATRPAAAGGDKQANDVEASQRVITGDAAAANRSPAMSEPISADEIQPRVSGVAYPSVVAESIAAPPAAAARVTYAPNVPAAAPGDAEAARGGDGLHSFLVDSKIQKVGVTTTDPEADHKVVKARLRAYEIEYEAKHGVKPRKRSEWGDMWAEYERYAVLRKMSNDKKQIKAGTPPIAE